eukprot:scaffold9965_cov17-Prasinocladus_malaysianus.AAC.1
MTVFAVSGEEFMGSHLEQLRCAWLKASRSHMLNPKRVILCTAEYLSSLVRPDAASIEHALLLDKLSCPLIIGTPIE